MGFEGYREDLRGDWFGGGTEMLYVDENNEVKFFIVNEQEEHLIRIRNEEQIKMLNHCMAGPQLKNEVIDWLVTKANYKYFDNVDEYITFRKDEFKKIMSQK